MRVHAVALADALQPRPGLERLGRCPRLPEIDAAGPAVLGVDELLADSPGTSRKPGAMARKCAAQAAKLICGGSLYWTIAVIMVRFSSAARAARAGLSVVYRCISRV